jgi:hypothetical protein
MIWKLIIGLGAFFVLVAVVGIFVCDTYYTVVASLSTFGLLLVAIIGSLYAARNISVLQARKRYDILFSLVDQMSSRDARYNRATIFNSWRDKGWDQGLSQGSQKDTVVKDIDNLIWSAREAVSSGRKDEDSLKIISTRDAVEETISLSDKVGYFLLESGDPKLIQEAPPWMLAITLNLWKMLGCYVEFRHKEQGTKGQPDYKPAEPQWAEYFEKLAHEAETELQRRGRMVT